MHVPAFLSLQAIKCKEKTETLFNMILYFFKNTIKSNLSEFIFHFMNFSSVIYSSQ